MPTQRFYLLRHAEAANGPIDEERPLTEHGRAQVRALASVLASFPRLPFQKVWHSGYLRAAETAEILLQTGGWELPVREQSGMTPMDPAGEMYAELLRQDEPVLLVGHDPHLSLLANLLWQCADVRDRSDLFALKKGALLGLAIKRKRFQEVEVRLELYLTPKIYLPRP